MSTRSVRPSRGRWAIGATALAASLVALGACGSSSKSATAAAPSSGPSQSVTFSLDYITDGLHAPVYVAKQDGYFAGSHLNVNIEPSGGSKDSITRVAGGSAQLGFADSGTVLSAIASQHVPVEVVGLLLNTEPFATITLKSSGITTPAQLKGKSVGAASATSDKAFFPAFLQGAGLTSGEVPVTDVAVSELVPSLLTGKVNAVADYAQVFAKYASQVNIMPWNHYGVDPYGTAIIANKAFAAAHPDAVRAFLKDTYQGLGYTVANPAKAAGVVAAASSGSTASYFEAELNILKPFWVTNSGGGYGRMTDSGWTNTQDLNTKYGIQQSSVPVSSVYTNQYLSS
jgi:NitT/TauT family transport system substrate-binding protein